VSPKDLNLHIHGCENSYVTGNIHIWPRFYVTNTRFTGLLLIAQTDVEVRISTDSKINILSAWQEILWFLVTGLSNRVSPDQETPLNSGRHECVEALLQNTNTPMAARSTNKVRALTSRAQLARTVTLHLHHAKV
jgi:hypothetical protein